MSETRVMLVVGATGAAASRILERGRTASGTGVLGLSSNRPEQSGAWLTADLNDGRRLPEVLATRPDITHIVYASCTAPGSLDNGLRYAARLKVCSSHAARASSGLRWPFFSISHSAL